MRTVYKYPLTQPEVTIELPRDARVVLVAIDPGSNFTALWVEHDLSHERVERTFVTHGTGHAVSDDPVDYETHVGSVVQGLYVWHIYERKCLTRTGTDQ